MCRIILSLLILVAIISIATSFFTHNTLFKLQYHSLYKLYATNNAAITWITSKEISCNDNRITINNDNQCIASTNIKKGESLFMLPRGICLDSEKSEKLFGTTISSIKLKTGDLGLLALLLLYERSLGITSKYCYYIQSLPTQTPGILGWSQENIDKFILSTTRNIQIQLSTITNDITLLLSLTSQLSPYIPPADLTEESLKWALGKRDKITVNLDIYIHTLLLYHSSTYVHTTCCYDTLYSLTSAFIQLYQVR